MKQLRIKVALRLTYIVIASIITFKEFQTVGIKM